MEARRIVQAVVGVLLSVSALGASTPVSRVLRVGETVRGSIPVADPNRAGTSFDFEVALPTSITVDVRSLEFDTFVTFWRVHSDATVVKVGEDGNGGIGTDSRFGFEAEAAARYRIEVQPSGIAFCGGSFEISATVGHVDAADAKAREEANQAYWKRLDERALGSAKPECTIEALLRRWSLVPESPPREARPDVEKALALAEERLGPDHLLVATCLVIEGRILVGNGSYGEATPLAERALAIQEKAVGPDHPIVAGALTVLGRAQSGLDAHAEALRTYERAVAILEKSLGPDHTAVAMGLLNLGIERWRMGEHAEALTALETSRRIYETNLGPDSPRVARVVGMIALLLQEAGEYARAQPLFERALAGEEKAYGPENDGVAERVNGLGLNLMALGDYAAARPALERALAIREKIAGADSIAVGQQSYNLGLFYSETGDYAKARSFLERALKIDEKGLGPEHASVAEDSAALATLLRKIGDYSEAKRLLDRALTISEKVLGPEHPDVAGNYVSLGRLLQAMGSYAEARAAYGRALAIQEKKLGLEHPSVATTLTALASLCSATGEYSKARELLERALAIQEKQLGPDHIDVSSTLGQLADVRRALGSSAEAKPLYERAIAVADKQLGLDNISITSSLDGLAGVLAETGDDNAALIAALREARISREHLRMTARTLPERQALRYASAKDSGVSLALSLADRLDPTARQEAWDAVIRSRALVLDEMASRHHAVLAGGDPELESLSRGFTTATQRLANLSVRGAGSDPPDRYRAMLDAARRTREDAEHALAEKSSAFRQTLARDGVGYEEVAESLPAGSALVAYVLYDRYDFPREGELSTKNSAAPNEKRKPVASYLAFIFRGGGSDAVVLPLGGAREIDALIADWQREAARGALAPGRSAGEAANAYRSAGNALRRKVWDPVATQLKDMKRLFIVPDGALHLVSFAALPAGKSEYLVETGPLLHYISAERDLVRASGTPAFGKGLLAVGGAAFDETSLFNSLSASLPVAGTAAGIFRGDRSGCGNFQSIRFGALPGSAREVEEIAGLWSRPNIDGSDGARTVDELTGAGASETAFKRGASGHRILHLATHGFFLGGRCASALDVSRGVTGLVGAETATPQSVVGDNPLLLSGLVLAGANHRDAAGPDEDDGILSAEEISALDLSGVEWAVLSACDTGVGEIKAGEGVLGLRRAFQVAGARTMIMSLWSVDDEAARSWMKALYTARFESRLDTAEAVRRADLDLLNDRRKRKLSTHPFYWAGFVAAGDWH